jgi:hypothetical protein
LGFLRTCFLDPDSQEAEAFSVLWKFCFGPALMLGWLALFLLLFFFLFFLFSFFFF